MNIILISCFNAYNNRLEHLIKYIEKNNHNYTLITSSYDHTKRQIRKKNTQTNTHFIDTPIYKKNISLYRLYSHYIFSYKTFKYLKKIKVDVIYVVGPPNSLFYFMSKYKKKYNSRLVFDVFDLWPESFPNKILKRIFFFPFMLWSNLRNLNLKYADYLIFECHLFRDKLLKYSDNLENSILYSGREKHFKTFLTQKDFEVLNICYLGSINHIIDIDMIIRILVDINKNRDIRLHIVGIGENLDSFISKLKQNRINFIYHGKIFDEKLKFDILSKCAFGLNIFKKSVEIGMSLKSMDYIQYSLPILNNLNHDIHRIILEYKIGWNIDENYNFVINELSKLSIYEINNFKSNTQKAFNNLLSIKNIYEIFEKAIF